MYIFMSGAGTVDRSRDQVGFAYSTMHVRSKAQKVADELQQVVIAYYKTNEGQVIEYGRYSPTPEFNIGETVVYKPYEKALNCTVKGYDFFGDRLFYILTGEAISKTTGLCIVGSRLYKAGNLL